jgi:hypothetical protein
VPYQATFALRVRSGRWATDDGLGWDDISWWALSLLHGIDLPDESGGYLHDDEQVRAWLAQLRDRRAR